jgi:ABC-2 type transport system ATP-binding protein
MSEIKARYPRNRVQISFEGDDSFLRNPSIETLKRYNGNAEIKLWPSATLADDVQALLASALQHARVTRFEVSEPALEQIFIEKVQEISPSKNDLELTVDRFRKPEGSYLGA